MNLQQFDRVRATFAPTVTTNLRPEMLPFVGWRGVWSAAWIIEDGWYSGQWAMCVWGDADGPVHWVPFGNLADVEPIDARDPAAGSEHSV